MSECKSCGQPIEWAKTETGKWMPVDPAPVPGGNLSIDRSSWPPVATVMRPGEGAVQLALGAGGQQEGETLGHVSHFKSCPDRDRWRKNEGRGR